MRPKPATSLADRMLLVVGLNKHKAKGATGNSWPVQKKIQKKHFLSPIGLLQLVETFAAEAARS